MRTTTQTTLINNYSARNNTASGKEESRGNPRTLNSQSKDFLSRLSNRTIVSYPVHGIERWLHKAGGREASGSPWSGRTHYGKMAIQISANSRYRACWTRFVQKESTKKCMCVKWRNWRTKIPPLPPQAPLPPLYVYE